MYMLLYAFRSTADTEKSDIVSISPDYKFLPEASREASLLLEQRCHLLPNLIFVALFLTTP